MSQKNFVVSANYRDRYSPYKYLVRRIEDPISSAVACKSVRAIDVLFDDSNQDERGFGCARVALCHLVEVRDIQHGDVTPEYFQADADPTVEVDSKSVVKTGLFFGGFNFYIDGTDTPVYQVRELELNGGEIMQAVI